jgi:type VI protein secretion system component Hcp
MRGYVIVGIALALASAPAMAGGKSGAGHVSTGDHPQESLSLNYTHVEQTYKPQAATKPKTKPVGTGTITHRKAGGTQQ